MQYVIGRASRLGSREINQDRLVVLEHDDGPVLLVLGDGLGGKAGGEIASETLVATITRLFEKHTFPENDPQQFLTDLILHAHESIIKVGQEQTPPIEPGTTAVLCLIQDGKACWAHVGDSRFYLYRRGVPLYKSTDHSYVEKLYQSGQIGLHERNDHPLRNVVTNCLGIAKHPPKPALSQTIPVQVGDILLLCTDGFWEPLDDAQVGAMLQDGRLDDTVNKLAERAEHISYPNSDNISVVAIQVLNLQLTGRPRPKAQIKPHSPSDNSIDTAIDEIQRALDEYSHEMKK